MRILIAADSFPPLKNSASVLVFSLAEAFASDGHDVLVVTSSSEINKKCIYDDYRTFKVLRIRCKGIKSYNKFLRGICELSLFFILPRHFNKSQFGKENWDLVIWYSPSIFLSGLVKLLKNKTKFSYLILRDIVPSWMVEIGLMKKGFSFYFLKWFEHYQYRLADVIGVQSSGNRTYIEKLSLPKLKKLEVLFNWMPSVSTNFFFPESKDELTNLQRTVLATRKVLIYAGNLGQAQGIENFAQIILGTKDQADFGFLIIGRGSKKKWLQDFIRLHQLDNVLMLDEVDLYSLSRFYSQCHAGLIFLDSKHQSHNIPGKFISYLEAGLPVVACVNSRNDLLKIIVNNKLGLVVNDSQEFVTSISPFLDSISNDKSYSTRSRDFYQSHYQPSAIARQILSTFVEQENLER